MKMIRTKSYAIIFDERSGLEIRTGINGYDDPFSLEFPSLLDIGIMGECKGNCSFCYQGEERQENMSLEKYKKIIDESSPYVTQVALGGRGDPDQHADFEEILKYTREKGVIPNYTTSGRDFSEKHACISKEYVGAVAVSDYGKEFTYSAIRILQQAKIKTNIHMVLSSASLQKAIRLLNGEDVWNSNVDIDNLNAVIFLLFKPVGRGVSLKSNCLSKDQVKEFAAALVNAKCSFSVGLDSCLVCSILTEAKCFSEKQMQCIDTCEAARMSAYITPDMKLKPCSFAGNDTAIPLTNSTIRSAWNSEVFARTRSLLQEEPNQCPFAIF